MFKLYKTCMCQLHRVHILFQRMTYRSGSPSVGRLLVSLLKTSLDSDSKLAKIISIEC